jgi:hypothetical protein
MFGTKYFIIQTNLVIRIKLSIEGVCKICGTI